MKFATAQAMFKDNKIQELADTPEGLRFLKLRSLSRKEHLKVLFESGGVKPAASDATAMFQEAFESNTFDIIAIDQVIREIYEEERGFRRTREPELVVELYEMQVFDWGGLYQNSLEKAIVNSYVKKITNFEMLTERIENEIHNRMRGYVQCSWYNHWTSVLIEDAFRDHPAVLPAVGLIKKIDFFLKGVPFDLKVTYFPEGYIKDRRRAANLRPELTLLKQWARRNNVSFKTELPKNRLLSDLWNRATDHPSSDGQELLTDLAAFRQELVLHSQRDPSDLIKWLYEKQGERRFDASNRLFLVLVDTANFFESWKLKRAKPLLDKAITHYLDRVSSSPGRSIEFNWEGASFKVISDAIIVTKPSN